jgi:2,4-diketo-3-deoxy-L-fuconate hydrolase
LRFPRIGQPGRETEIVVMGDDTCVDISDVTVDIDGTFLAALSTPVVADPLADHAEVSGLAISQEPIVFNKARNTVVGPFDDVVVPRAAVKTDWEVELGIVIGARARYLPSPEDAWAHIAGFTLVNDVSERVFQLERGGQWVKGKSCETFNPSGPWLVTPDEIADVHDLGMWLDVNGQRRQTGSTRTMIFNVPYIVWYLSQFMVLEPGDLINTGTPPGVGLGMTPPTYLAAGDVMELGIDRLGTQRQRLVAAY